MPKTKPQPKSEKRDDRSRSKERVEDLPVKGEQAAAVKGGAVTTSQMLVTKKIDRSSP